MKATLGEKFLPLVIETQESFIEWLEWIDQASLAFFRLNAIVTAGARALTEFAKIKIGGVFSGDESDIDFVDIYYEKFRELAEQFDLLDSSGAVNEVEEFSGAVRDATPDLEKLKERLKDAFADIRELFIDLYESIDDEREDFLDNEQVPLTVTILLKNNNMDVKHYIFRFCLEAGCPVQKTIVRHREQGGCESEIKLIKDSHCIRCDVYKFRKWLETNNYRITEDDVEQNILPM